MLRRISLFILYLSYFIFLFSSCKKDPKTIPDNTAPYYGHVSKVKVENYINRLFIDLIGREPFDSEMATEYAFLRQNELSFDSREQLITKLQENTDYIPGDSSYKYAYYNRFYEQCKSRTLESASDETIEGYAGLSSLDLMVALQTGDSLNYQLILNTVKKLENVIACQRQYREDSISINEVFARMINNRVYDEINMNTFNLLRASFDNLFYRYPTGEIGGPFDEMDAGYAMVEQNLPSVLFGKSGQNKGDYVNILVHSPEFYEGMIKWMYKLLLARDPSTTEVYHYMQTFFYDRDVQKLQRSILKTDEYANFF